MNKSLERIHSHEDHAFYRRWLHVQFPKQISEEQQSKQFDDELKKELKKILDQALEGYARLIQTGALPANSNLEKRDLSKEYNTPVERFVDERAELVTNAVLSKDKIYAAC